MHNSETMGELIFRNATPADETFVNDLIRTTMREYVEATWDSDKDRVHYYEINKFQLNGTKIIQLDGVDVGRMTVTRKREVIVLDEIQVLPEYQGRGLGSQAIQGLLAEATEKRIPVELMLLKLNPAKRLYDRLGFEVYQEDEERYYMKRAA
jgi:ribosomal protein S18 acetylase RimI-like enzyme